MTDQPTPRPDDTEPEDLLPEEVVHEGERAAPDHPVDEALRHHDHETAVAPDGLPITSDDEDVDPDAPTRTLPLMPGGLF